MSTQCHIFRGQNNEPLSVLPQGSTSCPPRPITTALDTYSLTLPHLTWQQCNAVSWAMPLAKLLVILTHALLITLCLNLLITHRSVSALFFFFLVLWLWHGDSDRKQIRSLCCTPPAHSAVACSVLRLSPLAPHDVINGWGWDTGVCEDQSPAAPVGGVSIPFWIILHWALPTPWSSRGGGTLEDNICWQQHEASWMALLQPALWRPETHSSHESQQAFVL